jgi:hypothetical protein
MFRMILFYLLLHEYAVYFIYWNSVIVIEGNAKSRHLKKLTCKGTLRQVFICLGPRAHIPPLHTVLAIYGPVIYTALEVETFLGPVKWHRADRRVPFGAQKVIFVWGNLWKFVIRNFAIRNSVIRNFVPVPIFLYATITSSSLLFL